MEVEKIRKMTEEGITPENIAAELGITIETLSAFCRVKEIKLNHKRPSYHKRDVSFGIDHSKTKPKKREGKVDPEVVKKMYYESDMLVNEIAKELDASPAKVSRVLKENNGKHLPTGRKAANQTNKDRTIHQEKYGTFHPDLNELKRLYTVDRLTRDELAEHYGVSRGSIDLKLATHDIRLTKDQRKLRKGTVKSRKAFEEAVKEHKTARAVAKHFCITIATAYYHSNNFGIKFENGHRTSSHTLKELAYEYLESDMKLSQFAKEKGVNYQSLYQMTQRLGIDVPMKKIKYRKEEV